MADKPKYPFATFGFSLVNFKGDNTDEDYTGNFEAKEFLSHRDHLAKDSTRRNLLGERPETAERTVALRAEMLSHLSVSLVDFPKYWRDSGGGLDLYDDNVIFEVYGKVVKGQVDAQERIAKKGEEAKAELRKAAKKKPKEDEPQEA